MQISVGKNVEGTSNHFYLPNGQYVFQIVEITVEEGKVSFVMVTAENQRAYKTFYLTGKDNDKPNEKALRELADFVTTALQIEEDDATVEVEDALGYYVLCSYRNSTYEKDGVTKAVAYVNNPKRADGFPNDAPSLLDKYQKKKKSRNSPSAKAAKKAVAQEPEAENEAEENEASDDVMDMLADIGL